MRAPGNIELPLRAVQEVGYSEIEAFDLLFDMNIPNLCDILNDQVRLNIPGVAVVRSTTHPITALVFYKPPAGIRMYDKQRYQLFVAPNLDLLIKYFSEWYEFNEDIYLKPMLSSICNILRSKCGRPLKIKSRSEAI